MVEKLSSYAQSKVVGDPFGEKTELGPLVAERQVVKLEEQLKDALDKALAQKAIRDLKAGTIISFGANPYRPPNPFGGYKKSGMGRTAGIQGFHDSVQVKTVGRKK